jgi:hypothetical protein
MFRITETLFYVFSSKSSKFSYLVNFVDKSERAVLCRHRKQKEHGGDGTLSARLSVDRDGCHFVTCSVLDFDIESVLGEVVWVVGAVELYIRVAVDCRECVLKNDYGKLKHGT